MRAWPTSCATGPSRCQARHAHDQITLRMTRAEIGNYLGMTLETVSRALSRLARDKVIALAEKGRRDVHIPDVGALSAFVQRCLSPAPHASVISRFRHLTRHDPARWPAPTPRGCRACAAVPSSAASRGRLPAVRPSSPTSAGSRGPEIARCASAASCVPRIPGPSAMSVSSRSKFRVRSERQQRLLAAGRAVTSQPSVPRKVRTTLRTSASSSTSSTFRPVGTASPAAGVCRRRVRATRLRDVERDGGAGAGRAVDRDRTSATA